MKGTRAAAPSQGSPASPPDEKPAGWDALPARFKGYFRKLEHELHELRSLRDAVAETRVRLESYGGGRDKARFLPDDSRVVFVCARDGRDWRIEVQMDRRRGSNGVQVSSPDGRLVVMPEVSNEVCVRAGDY